MGLIPSIILLFMIFLLLLVMIISKQYTWRNEQQLPPGSMGWPFIGESLQLFSQSPSHFFSTRQNKYGDIFKTNILGYRCITVAKPDAIRYILVRRPDLFKPTYPKGKEKLIGEEAIFFQAGGSNYHGRIRKIVQSSLSLDRIKTLVPLIESVVVSTLDSWTTTTNGGCYERLVFHELKKMAFEVAVLYIFGELDDECYKMKLKEKYCVIDKGYNSFPILIPGTRYYKSFKARKELEQLIEEIILKRKEKKMESKDLLGQMLNFRDQNGEVLSKEQVSDNIIGVLFAAQDTTATLLTWIIKYITDDKRILQAIKEEQRPIYESNEKGKRGLTWGQTRSMVYTHKVIQESQRMASIISFTYREATKDVEFDGYRVPKGWKVLPLFRNIHHNPSFYQDPQTFNPSRFEVGPKPNTFMPFGCGIHSCPGNELAKLEILIFIHHLVNKCNWEVIGGSSDVVQYMPFPVPKNGLPTTFWRI